jgi:membrane-associated phospholipid phosphatase
MLLWAGVALILLGLACLPVDRRAAHYLYDHESAALERFLENTTHWAKAGHWLAAAAAAIAVAQIVLWLDPGAEGALRARTYALALIACLAVGSAILHAMKLVVGRRRPRDDMELGLYEFVWFKFKLDYNSFPSGHSLTISCVAVIATCAAPQLAVLWFAVAAWLALTRAVLTAHFLSDVFVGAGIGLLAARATLLYFFIGLSPSWY